ncbi:hypothetical protein H5410_012688 [Solanum commersonii]|uniref:Uncharacterized protein n=1 Tax=Solanum commersonii TaxID=4109 RepID=A0A9J6ASD6_SOLCO|nr:hypothetical protein H5410_012688 [Solanum commersonii]
MTPLQAIVLLQEFSIDGINPQAAVIHLNLTWFCDRSHDPAKHRDVFDIDRNLDPSVFANVYDFDAVMRMEILIRDADT